MTDAATTATARVPRLETTGAALVTVAGGFSLYALVYSLGTGEPMSLAAAAVAILLAASAAAMWRLGPRRVEPLVIGLALCGAGLLVMQSPLIAVAPTLLAGAIAVRRVAVGDVAHCD